MYLLRNGFENRDIPGIEYSNIRNQLRVGALVSNGQVEKYTVDNIPTHRWNHIVVIGEDRNLDTYLNGELVKSFKLNGVPVTMEGENLSLYPEYRQGKYVNAQITLVRTFPLSLSGEQVREIYKKNNGDQVPRKGMFWWTSPFWKKLETPK